MEPATSMNEECVNAGKVTVTAGIEPAGLRYDYAPSSRTNAPVALLPGLFAGEWMWESTSARLRAEGFGVIRLRDPLAVLDRGSGGIEHLRPTLCAVLDQHAVERCTLCGNSLAGLVAQDFARHYPQRVDSWVLIGAPALGPEITLGTRTHRHVSPEFVVH